MIQLQISWEISSETLSLQLNKTIRQLLPSKYRFVPLSPTQALPLHASFFTPPKYAVALHDWCYIARMQRALGHWHRGTPTGLCVLGFSARLHFAYSSRDWQGQNRKADHQGFIGRVFYSRGGYAPCWTTEKTAQQQIGCSWL